VTHAETIAPSDVRKLWQDPLLRFSRALDGLFHEGVVVCEGHADSQFYSAVSYCLAEAPGDPAAGHADGADVRPRELTSNPFDVLFTAAGGKQRLRLVAAALSKVHVPVRCIADFDLLRSPDDVKRLVESLGGEWTPEQAAALAQVDAGLRGHHRARTIGETRTALTDILTGDEHDPVTGAIAEAVEEALKDESGWGQAKRFGVVAVPAGQASIALETVLAELRSVGIYIVPVGEVEAWVKSAPKRGWIAKVIEEDLVSQASEAQAFLNQVLDSIS
jgi:hypothetical protein